MAAIIAQHYRDNYQALSKEPVIISMATQMLVDPGGIPFKVTHDGGDPTWEFMQAARTYYAQALDAGAAATQPESIGATAQAVLIARAHILNVIDGLRG